MPQPPYSDDELDRYFSDPNARRAAAPASASPEESRRRSFQVLRGVGVGFAAAVGVLLIALIGLSFTLPPTELIENPEHLESTVVYTSDGVEMARYYLGQNRTWVGYADISPAMRDALVAVEDRRFYDHWGVDMRGFFAVAADAVSGDGLRGASTLSMQLARNLYEQIGFERSPVRKLREILTAIQIERRYTKDEILEMYLNTVPWGNNAFGIEAAARTYFNKPAAELAVEEAAVLAGMLKGTTIYSPVRNPERSRNRRNIVLASMVRAGTLQNGRYAELRDEPIQLDFSPYSHTDNLAPHLAEILRKQLEEWGRRNGRNIYTDGLVVHTSIDSRIQAMAQAAVEQRGAMLQAVVDVEWSARSLPVSANQEEPYVEYVRSRQFEPWAHFWATQGRLTESFIRDTDRFRSLRRQGTDPGDALAQLRADEAFMDSLRTSKTRLEVGLVAIEPQTGHVRAWVGGRDFVADKFDHVATARRQTGSTFKPFVYVAAIDNGYSPYYRVADSAFVWRQAGQPDWRPRNFGGGAGGVVTLRAALAQSRNIATARLTQEVGPATVRRYAQRLGIESPLEAVPSIGLGVADATLLEMTGAYAALANYGVHNAPSVITRIEDRQGNLLEEFRPQSREAVSPNTAFTVVDMMRDVVDGGTGTRIRWKFGLREHDFSGKTGTTQESADGWFLLMHPDLVMGAWVGFNDRRIQFRSSGWGQGSRNALHVVGDFAARVARAESPDVRLNAGRRFEQPAGYVPPAPPPPQPDRDELTPVGRLLEEMRERDRRTEEAREASRRQNQERGRVGW
jgi:penicillin-binding protein 1A